MKSGRIAVICTLLILSVFLSACGVSQASSPEPETDFLSSFGQAAAEPVYQQDYLEESSSPLPETSNPSEPPDSQEPETAESVIPPEEPEPPVPIEASAAVPEQVLPLSGRIICIDPGHAYTAMTGQEQISPLSSDTKMQCTGGTAGSYQTESQLNLAVGLALRDYLEQLGAEVVMTRTSQEELVSNIQRATIANNAGADLCLRLHADGSEDISAHGISMQLPSGELLGTPEIAEPSWAAGTCILEAVAAATGAYNRGTVPRSDLTGFNWSEVPCVLLEMGFMSNPEEDALLADSDYQASIVSGIADGICAYFSSSVP